MNDQVTNSPATSRVMRGDRARRLLAFIGVYASTPVLLALDTSLLFVLVTPAVSYALGTTAWPGQTRRQALLAATAMVLTGLVVYMLFVFWFYGLVGPTGFWLPAGPLAALAVYAAGGSLVARRPWAWPAVAALALLAMAAVGALALLTGVRFES
jgi:hypothetical protein